MSPELRNLKLKPAMNMEVSMALGQPAMEVSMALGQAAMEVSMVLGHRPPDVQSPKSSSSTSMATGGDGSGTEDGLGIGFRI